REAAVGQHLAASLASRAVVGLVVGVANALNLSSASRTRLTILPMHGHVFAIDNVTGRRKNILRVDTQHHPSRTIRELHIGNLLWRLRGRVENVYIIVDAV